MSEHLKSTDKYPTVDLFIPDPWEGHNEMMTVEMARILLRLERAPTERLIAVHKVFRDGEYVDGKQIRELVKLRGGV